MQNHDFLSILKQFFTHTSHMGMHGAYHQSFVGSTWTFHLHLTSALTSVPAPASKHAPTQAPSPTPSALAPTTTSKYAFVLISKQAPAYKLAPVSIAAPTPKLVQAPIPAAPFLDLCTLLFQHLFLNWHAHIYTCSLTQYVHVHLEVYPSPKLSWHPFWHLHWHCS
jgi:hypothetical protein